MRARKQNRHFQWYYLKSTQLYVVLRYIIVCPNSNLMAIHLNTLNPRPLESSITNRNFISSETNMIWFTNRILFVIAFYRFCVECTFIWRFYGFRVFYYLLKAKIRKYISRNLNVSLITWYRKFNDPINVFYQKSSRTLHFLSHFNIICLYKSYGDREFDSLTSKRFSYTNKKKQYFEFDIVLLM